MRNHRILATVLALFWGCASQPQNQGFSEEEASRLRADRDQMMARHSPIAGPSIPPETARPSGTPAPMPALLISSEQPDWASGTSSRYDDEHYIVGVGLGPTRESAERAALAEMARVFMVHVESRQEGSLRDARSLHKANGDRQTAEQLSRVMIEDTKVSTQKMLSGARIAQVWVDHRSRHTYALAVLERQPAAAALADAMAELDARIHTEIDLAKDAQGRGERTLHLSRALATSMARNKLSAELRIVMPRNAAVAAGIPEQDIRDLLLKSQDSSRVGLEVTGDQADAMRACLAQAITSDGYALVEADEQMLFRAKVEIAKAGILGDSVMARATLVVEVVDTTTHRLLGSAHDDQKVGRPDWDATVRLAVSKLCGEAAPKVMAQLKGLK